MTEYICKCGRIVNKSTNADNTGNRDTTDCAGCPYLMPWGPIKWDETRHAVVTDIQGYECRMSPTLSYITELWGNPNDKCTMQINSLDLDFLERVSAWIKEQYPDGEISGGFSCSSIRACEYVANGRYRMSISCAQNKKGIEAKSKLLQAFFDPESRTRIDISPGEEQQIILDRIQAGRKAAQGSAAELDKPKQCPYYHGISKTYSPLGYKIDCDLRKGFDVAYYEQKGWASDAVKGSCCCAERYEDCRFYRQRHKEESDENMIMDYPQPGPSCCPCYGGARAQKGGGHIIQCGKWEMPVGDAGQYIQTIKACTNSQEEREKCRFYLIWWMRENGHDGECQGMSTEEMQNVYRGYQLKAASRQEQAQPPLAALSSDAATAAVNTTVDDLKASDADNGMVDPAAAITDGRQDPALESTPATPNTLTSPDDICNGCLCRTCANEDCVPAPGCFWDKDACTSIGKKTAECGNYIPNETSDDHGLVDIAAEYTSACPYFEGVTEELDSDGRPDPKLHCKCDSLPLAGALYELSCKDNIDKIRSGISGETEPLKQLGINMSVANMQAYALSQGINKSYGSMSQAEQMTLHYNYLLSVTADAQGDFARTSGSLANQQKLLKENFSQLSAKIMTGAIPALSAGAQKLNTMLASMDTGSLSKFVAQIAQLGVDLMPIAMDLMPVIQNLMESILPPLLELIKIVLPPITRFLNLVIKVISKIISIGVGVFKALFSGGENASINEADKTLSLNLGKTYFATGGFASRPSIFGEAGLEAAIPIKRGNQRSLSLLQRTAQLLGVSNRYYGGSNFTYAPVIQGGNPEQIEPILRKHYDKLKCLWESMQDRRRRLSFA